MGRPRKYSKKNGGTPISIKLTDSDADSKSSTLNGGFKKRNFAGELLEKKAVTKKKNEEIECYDVGDLVFVKTYGFEPWPARIEEVFECEALPGQPKEYLYAVMFFGNHEVQSDIETKDVFLYNAENIKKFGKPKRMKTKFEAAMFEIENSCNVLAVDPFNQSSVPGPSSGLSRSKKEPPAAELSDDDWTELPLDVYESPAVKRLKLADAESPGSTASALDSPRSTEDPTDERFSRSFRTDKDDFRPYSTIDSLSLEQNYDSPTVSKRIDDDASSTSDQVDLSDYTAATATDEFMTVVGEITCDKFGFNSMYVDRETCSQSGESGSNEQTYRDELELSERKTKFTDVRSTVAVQIDLCDKTGEIENVSSTTPREANGDGFPSFSAADDDRPPSNVTFWDIIALNNAKHRKLLCIQKLLDYEIILKMSSSNLFDEYDPETSLKQLKKLTDDAAFTYENVLCAPSLVTTINRIAAECNDDEIVVAAKGILSYVAVMFDDIQPLDLDSFLEMYKEKSNRYLLANPTYNFYSRVKSSIWNDI